MVDRVSLGEMEDGKRIVLAVETPIGINTSQLAEAAEALKMLHDSWINAGFSEEQAMKLMFGVMMRK